MPAPFKESPPDPTKRSDRRKRERIELLIKGNRANPLQRKWAAEYDAVKAGAPAAPAPTPAPAAPSAPPAPSNAEVLPKGAPVPAAAPAASVGRPLPVPALAPSNGATNAPPGAAPPGKAAPNPAPKSSAAPGTPAPDGPMFPEASAAVQAARQKALEMVIGTVAKSFEELHVGVMTTMQGANPLAFDVEFWTGPWAVMCVGMLNRYLPDWMGGIIVEGVAVGLPPGVLFMAANKLQKAGYTIGIPGEPGRGRGVGATKPRAAEPVKEEPKAAAPSPTSTPAAGTALAVVPKEEPANKRPVERGGKDAAVANKPAPPKSGPFDPKKAFGRD